MCNTSLFQGIKISVERFKDSESWDLQVSLCPVVAQISFQFSKHILFTAFGYYQLLL